MRDDVRYYLESLFLIVTGLWIAWAGPALGYDWMFWVGIVGASLLALLLFLTVLPLGLAWLVRRYRGE